MSIESLFRGIEMLVEFGKMSDLEIATLLLEEVWAECKIDSRSSALIESAIDRLRRTQSGPLEEPFSEWHEPEAQERRKRGRNTPLRDSPRKGRK